jgi:hypothetical protein
MSNETLAFLTVLASFLISAAGVALSFFKRGDDKKVSMTTIIENLTKVNHGLQVEKEAYREALDKQEKQHEDNVHDIILRFTDQIKEMDERHKKEINELRIQVTDSATKQYQLSQNIEGITRQNKRLMDWIKKAREVFMQNNIVPPPLEFPI